VLKVLTSKATVLIRSSVYPLSHDDLATPGVKEKLQKFDSALKLKLAERHDPILIEHEADEDTTFVPYKDPENSPSLMPEADDLDYDGYDTYISARLWLPNASGIATHAKVTQRKRDNDGQLIGHSHSNPLLDTSLYDVEFDDGRVGTYSANIIA
jgi:hypothetical protein